MKLLCAWAAVAVVFSWQLSLAGELGNEDLTAVRSWFQEKDSGLEWFGLLQKQPVDSTRAAMLVSAAPIVREDGRLPHPSRSGHTGLFIVSGAANRIEQVLDFRPYSLDEPGLAPVIESAPGALYLHYISDYGFYHGSVKYLYSPGSKEEAKRLPYGRLSFRSRAIEDGIIRYAGSFVKAGSAPEGVQELDVAVTVRPGASLVPPAVSIEKGPQVDRTATGLDGIPPQVFSALPHSARWNIDVSHSPRLLPASRGRWVYLQPGSSPYGEQTSSVLVIHPDGSTQIHAVPVPAPHLYNETRPGRVKPTQGFPPELNNSIGPAAIEGDTLWFASNFYDGEGMSGVGAIVSLDLRSGQYEMRHLPEIADWSGSALLLDGEDIWVGLQRNPEGAPHGGGLLRYNRKSGAAQTYPMKDLIYTIDRLGAYMFLGTAHGVYQMDPASGRLAQFRIEPDATGKLAAVVRDVE